MGAERDSGHALNAMDVSQPNNWPRVEELFRRKVWRLGDLGYAAVTDETTKATMRELKAVGYTSEPHAAIAYRALRDQLQPGEYGLFLGTAHPAKFKEAWKRSRETLPLPKSWPSAPTCRCCLMSCPQTLPRCVS